jgi:hypothetical protein
MEDDMKKLIFNFIILCFLFLSSITCKEESDPVSSTRERIGAICNDGTTSTATGSGACSSHGGVKEWIYR